MKHEDISLNTKKELSESLKKILKKKPFNKVTVSELIQDCNINRKTFYYHFDDKYALLKWMFEQEAIEIVNQYDLLVDYEEAVAFCVNYIENNDYILNCICDSVGYNELKRFFYADFLGTITSIIEQAEHITGKTLDHMYKDFLCRFFTEAMAGMLVNWIKEKKTRNPAVIADYLSVTIRESIMGILENGSLSV